MPGWKQWSQAAWVGALALLVWSSPAPAETVTERAGSVDRDSEVSGDTDSFGADAVDSQAGTLSKTFNAPDPRTFRDFTEQEKQNQAPESKIDLILSEGWSKDSVSESETAIGVDLLTNDITSANQFPILADGNLNSGSGGSGGSGGEDPHWAAQVVNVNVNITAYRPQHGGTTIYDPFPRTAVAEADETDADLGPGIRINGDDDNGNAAADRNDNNVPGDNDLIEIVLKHGNANAVQNIQLVLRRSNASIKVWKSRTKGGAANELVFNAQNEHILNIADFNQDNELTIWTEWAAAGHGQSDLEFEARTPAAVLSTDAVKFHTFKGIIIAWGGNGNNPLNANDGAFITAKTMYETGYDVFAYNEEEADNPDYDNSIAFNEVITATSDRKVEDVGIVGYSQGGGATQELAQALNNSNINVNIAVYIDAVDHNGVNAENDYPNGTDYLLNIFQENGILELGGGQIAANTGQGPNDTLEEIDVTNDPGWNQNLNHFDIDEDPQVLQRIEDRLIQEVSR